MYVAFLIYCSFLSYCLQLVSYSYFITDYLFSVSLSFFLSLFRLVLVWYWHWWQGLWKFYSIKDFNIIKTFKRKKLLYHDIYRYRDIKLVILCDIRFWSYRPPLLLVIELHLFNFFLFKSINKFSLYLTISPTTTPCLGLNSSILIFFFFSSKCPLSHFYKLISYITMYHTLQFQAIYILHNIQIKCNSYE